MRQANWLGYLCGPLIFCATFQLSAAPVTFNTALPVSEGEGVVRVQAKYLSATGDLSSMNRELTVKALPIVGVWGVTSRWKHALPRSYTSSIHYPAHRGRIRIATARSAKP